MAKSLPTRIKLDLGGLSADGDSRYKGPPPQCVTCSKFVKVATARKIYEPGEFGTVLSVEFECERCAKARRS